MDHTSINATIKQMVRYGVVGILNNALGYMIYLVVTWLWLDPKIALTLLYPIGATTAYFGHAKYSFNYSGHTPYSIFRYMLAHMTGYGVNLAMLFFLVDQLGYPHQLVQAASIVVVAGVLYILFRCFVFAQRIRPS